MKRIHKPYSKELQQLLGKASSNILNARAAMAKIDGNDSERAKQFFEQAAEFEQESAMQLEAEGHHEDVYISLVSAASCYQNAERYDKALLLFRQALARPEMPPKLRSKVKLLSKHCEIALRRCIVTSYYVYEHWTAENKARVHFSYCSYCNYGRVCSPSRPSHRTQLRQRAVPSQSPADDASPHNAGAFGQSHS